METSVVASSQPYQLTALRWPSAGGEVCEIPVEEAFTEGEAASFVWVRIIMHDIEAVRSLLTQQLKLPSDGIDYATTPLERPRLREVQDVLLLVTHVPRYHRKKVYFDRLAFFLRGRSLISIEFKQTSLLDHWYERCDKRGLSIGSEPGQVLAALLDAVVDEYFPMMDELGRQLDQLEDLVLAQTPVRNKDILRLKRRLLETRRHVGPTRDVLNGLLRRDVPNISTQTRNDLQDVYDHTLRILDQIDLDLDLLSTLIDAHLAVISNRLGYTTQLLTVVATVLMSVSLIAGIYGMNFPNMPELSWPWGYAFAWALMLSIAAVELWYFRKKKWF
ncbi:MAG: magnesium/cobalt transporter CorA [Fimbriimonadaceae bacterium]|nr:magnesium/cobalt transporter CorA [Fimbriimonadaceae bacterium]